MIKIQVLGRGMIPRDLGIAPRKEPFYADRDVIYTILSTPGLSINYLHPENGKMFPLTKDNMKKVLDRFKNATYDKPVSQVTAHPHSPDDLKKEDTKTEDEKKVVPPATPVQPEPPKTVAPPPQPVTTPIKNDSKVEAPKKEDTKTEDEKKSDDKKSEDKTDDKKDTKSGGLKPVPAPEKK